MFKVINNLDEYKKLLNDLQDSFGCEEDWEAFFGFELKWNEETGEVLETIFDYEGKIELMPESFPVVVCFNFTVEHDFRLGDLTIRQFDWITMDEINKELKE